MIQCYYVVRIYHHISPLFSRPSHRSPPLLPLVVCISKLSRYQGRKVHFADSAGMQLNGYIPSIVGKEPTCWVELCREPDKVFLQLAVVAQKRLLISAQKKESSVSVAHLASKLCQPNYS